MSSDSSNSPAESPISEQQFVKEWRASEEKGLTHLVLITANRLRLGKTYAALRLGELLDKNFTIDNVGFETLWYIEKADRCERGSILVLDEPNRAAGNRSWFTEENRAFAEYLQTNAYRGIHGLFPLPHLHLIDNAVQGVCTAQIVMDKPGVGWVYTFERDQLNRSYSTYTPNWGDLYLKPPSAKLAHAYEKKRDEYTRAKNAQTLKKMRENMDIAASMTKRDVLSAVLAEPEKFWDETKKAYSVKRIMGEFGVSSHKAYDVKVQAEARRIKDKITPFSQ